MTHTSSANGSAVDGRRPRAWWRHTVRVRLAVWHTATLALLLMAFACGAYLFLARVTLSRIDRELEATARNVAVAWTTEQSENRSTAREAASEVLAEVRDRSLRVLMYDGRGRYVGASDSTALTPLVTIPRMIGNGSTSVVPLVRRSSLRAPRYETIGHDDGWVRVVALKSDSAVDAYTVVVARDMIADDEIKDIFLGWMLGAIPVALIFAGIGGYLLARASLSPIVAMGAQAEHIGASSLSERLLVQHPHDELGQLAGRLNGLLERLERSFVQQQQFMADASHELRTPVAVVRGVADVALERKESSVQSLQDALRTVSAEGQRMTRIVDDLFLLARADSGHQPVRRTQLYLEEQLADAASAGRALGRTRGVTVLSAPCAESAFLGDDTLIRRLLLNLVDNAIKHSPRDGVVQLSLDLTHHALLPTGLALPGTWFRLAVSDNGPGVDPNIRDSLFERFVRSAEYASPDGGAGLGLAIAKWIATAHAGHVVLEATGPTGSRFVVWLPAGAI